MNEFVGRIQGRDYHPRQEPIKNCQDYLFCRRRAYSSHVKRLSFVLKIRFRFSVLRLRPNVITISAGLSSINLDRPNKSSLAHFSRCFYAGRKRRYGIGWKRWPMCFKEKNSSRRNCSLSEDRFKAFVLVSRRDNDQGHFKSPFEPLLSLE